MILAEDEVDLGTDHSGIMLLDEAEPGTPLADVLPLAETCCSSSRPATAPTCSRSTGSRARSRRSTTCRFAPRPGAATPGASRTGTVDIAIDDFEGCPRYIGRLFEDVAIAPSPVWLRARLTAAGMRPISNVVDITNYVMLALGNPLHAFDFSTLARRPDRRPPRRAGRAAAHARRRRARARPRRPADRRRRARDRARRDHGRRGDRDRRDDDRRCCSRRRTSSRTASTAPPSASACAPRARTAGRRASTRTSPGRRPSSRRELMLELTGARWTATRDVHGDAARAARRPLPARARRRADRRRDAARAPVRACSAGSASTADGEDVVVPTWRARDVTREIDVVEEIARFRLEDVPTRCRARREMFGRLTREQALRRRVEDVLVGLGFTETYTPSLAARRRHRRGSCPSRSRSS